MPKEPASRRTLTEAIIDSYEAIRITDEVDRAMQRTVRSPRQAAPHSWLGRLVAAAGRYAQIKYRLAEAYRHDRHGNTDAKVPLVWEIMARADRWSQEVGWEPGPTDA